MPPTAPKTPIPLSSLVKSAPPKANTASLFGAGPSGIGIGPGVGSLVPPSVAVGAGKEVLDTFRGLGELGGSTVNWLLGKGFTPSAPGGLEYAKQPLVPGGGEKFAQKDLAPKGAGETIGKTGAQIAEFFAPAGAEEKAITKATEFLPKLGEFAADESGNLTKVGKVLKAGIKSLVHGASAGAVTAAQTGSGKEGAKVGGLVGALDAPIAIGGKLLGGILKNVASFTSGQGRAVIDQIVKEPKAALEGMGQDVASGLREASAAIKKYAAKTYDYAKEQYGKGLEDIEKKYGLLAKDVTTKPENGLNMIFGRKGTNVFKKDGEGLINLSLTSFKQKMTSVFKDFGVEGDFKKGFDFSNAVSSDLERVLKNVYSRVKGFSNVSPTGVNDLIRNLDGIGEKTKLPEAKAAISRITRNMRDYLGERVPEIKELNAGYAKVSQFLEDLDTHLSTGVKGDIKAGAKSEEGILQTANKIANLFGNHKELARQFVSGIPVGAEMLGQQAGRMMEEGVKMSGFAGGGGAIQRALESAIPTKMTGWLTAKGSQLASMLSKLAPAEQALIRELFVSSAGGNQNTPSSSAPSSSSAPAAGAARKAIPLSQLLQAGVQKQ